MTDDGQALPLYANLKFVGDSGSGLSVPLSKFDTDSILDVVAHARRLSLSTVVALHIDFYAGLPYDEPVSSRRKEIAAQFELAYVFALECGRRPCVLVAPNMEAYAVLREVVQEFVEQNSVPLRLRDWPLLYVGTVLRDEVPLQAPTEPMLPVRAVVADIDLLPWPYKAVVYWRSEWEKELPWLRFDDWCSGVYDSMCVRLTFGRSAVRRFGPIDAWWLVRDLLIRRAGRKAVARRIAISRR